MRRQNSVCRQNSARRRNFLHGLAFLLAATVLGLLAPPAFAQPAAGAAVVALPAAPTVVVPPDRIEIDAQAQIRLEEGRLVVQAEYQLKLREPGVATLQAVPLRLPLLAPVVGGVPLDAGLLPVQGQSIEIEQQGSVKVARRAGALEVTGAVSQDQPATVQVRYSIGLHATHVQLGIVGRGPRTWMTVVVQAVAPARVRLAVDRAARVSRFEQGSDRLTGASLARPLQDGEVAIFALADLPGPARNVRQGLLGLAALLLVLATATLWSHRPLRSRVEPT